MKFDISEIGGINCYVNFDEDLYQDYIEENHLQNNHDTLLYYIKENCEFTVSYLDSDYYRDMNEYEDFTYDELVEDFGETLANEILKDCVDGKEHTYELALYQNDEKINLNNSEELNAAAVKYLRHGEYYKNCRGFILTNGVIVYTEIEHNQSSKIPGVTGTFDFISLGNIRILSHSMDMAQEPTQKQYAVIREVLDSYYGEVFYLDIMNKEIGHWGTKYDFCEPDEVIRDIVIYFRRGNKNMNEIKISQNELQGLISECIKNVLKETDRHREGYWKERWAKQKAEKEKNKERQPETPEKKKPVKKDRHKPGYYHKYNQEHPERLNRGFTKGYVNGNVSDGPIQPKPNYPDGCLKDLGNGYYIDRMGWKRSLNPLTDMLLIKQQEWHDDDWEESQD